MSTTTWNGQYMEKPAGGESLAGADDELRNLKGNFKAIMEKEHYFDLEESSPVVNKMGRTRPGSAKVFCQDTLPVQRPGTSGVTFDDTDVGRLWYKTTSVVLNPNIASTVQIRGDQRFGLYILQKDGSVFYWVPVDCEVRGSVKTWLGAFTNPTDGQWYNTGTMPGWYVLKNVTQTINNVPGVGNVVLPALPADTLMGLWPTSDGLNPSTLSSKLAGNTAPIASDLAAPVGDNQVTLDSTNVPDHWHNVTDNTAAGMRTNTPLSGGDGNGGGSFGVAFSAADFRSTADGGNDANKHTHHTINATVSGQVQVNTLPSPGYPGVTAVNSPALSINDNPMWHIHSLTTAGQNPRTEYTQRASGSDNADITPVVFDPKNLQFSLLVRLY